jgi:hypothetical protein
MAATVFYSVRRERQAVRKRIKEHFGCVDQHFKLTTTASNIVRIARTVTAVPQGAT